MICSEDSLLIYYKFVSHSGTLTSTRREFASLRIIPRGCRKNSKQHSLSVIYFKRYLREGVFSSLNNIPVQYMVCCLVTFKRSCYHPTVVRPSFRDEMPIPADHLSFLSRLQPDYLPVLPLQRPAHCPRSPLPNVRLARCPAPDSPTLIRASKAASSSL